MTQEMDQQIAGKRRDRISLCLFRRGLHYSDAIEETLLELENHKQRRIRETSWVVFRTGIQT
jgi:hypothetical protein